MRRNRASGLVAGRKSSPPAAGCVSSFPQPGTNRRGCWHSLADPSRLHGCSFYREEPHDPRPPRPARELRSRPPSRSAHSPSSAASPTTTGRTAPCPTWRCACTACVSSKTSPTTRARRSRSTLAGLDGDRHPRPPGLGHVVRAETSRSTWSSDSAPERLRDDLARAVADDVAIDIATGEIDPMKRNVALHALRAAYEAIPSFSSIKQAGGTASACTSGTTASRQHLHRQDRGRLRTNREADR